MKQFKKLSELTLGKATVLTTEQMSKVYGKSGCYLRCDQNAPGGQIGDKGDVAQTPNPGIEVQDCNREPILKYCPSVENAICGGSVGC